jgi:hypothetical protein
VIGPGAVGVQDTCDVDAIAAATVACPAVARLDEGGAQAVATYLPGRRVVGVRVEEDRVLVSVVLASGSSVRSLEAQVRSALAAHAGGRRVDVHVADLQTAVDLA